jgi:hypothetical protein
MLLNTQLTGSHVYDTNFRLRFLMIFLIGVVAIGSVVYWRSQLIFSQEYVEFPQDNRRVREKHLPVKASASTERLEKELHQDE